MEPYIVYNGRRSDELGIVVEQLPDLHRARRRVEQNTLPGRSGALVVDEGAFDTYVTQLKINIFGGSIHHVLNWLRGEGWLISSDDPTLKAYVYMTEQIEDKRFRVERDNYDTLTIPLLVEPFLRQVSERKLTLTAPGSFPGLGHDPALPLLGIHGDGDCTVTINGRRVMLSGIDYGTNVDCEAGIAYQMRDGGLVWAGNLATLPDGWPQLYPEGQTNTVTWSGGVTMLEIVPQWRFL